MDSALAAGVHELIDLALRRAGTGPPLVLVHGYLASSEIWSDLIARESQARDVIAPDLAGFGDSAALPALDRIEAHAEAVLAMLDRLEVGRFDLLGHSMGGMIVQAMAALAPERVERLVLYGTGPVGAMPDRFEPIAESRRRLDADGLEATAERIAATWFLEGREASGFPLSARLGRGSSIAAARASLDAWERWDGRPNLARIRADALVIWGDRDRSYPFSQPLALWQGIPGASLAVVPRAAHAVHLEKPDLFGRILDDFLAAGAGGG